MNTEKTKTIWFGSKRGSKDKLAISSDLVWDDSEFTLLGLEFSVNLPSIPIKNYSKAISSINKTIESWKYRKTTPIGKITIIKSLLLSKLVHLFMLLPITDKILKEINSILYKFLWGGKADKVNRQDVCKPYIKGGLQMTDIFLFEKRMKLKWLQLIMNSNSKGWFKLLDKCLGNVNNIFIFGTEWCIKTKHCLNPFWESVFRYWTDIEKSHQFESNDDIWSNCLWYNNKLGTQNICFQDWVNMGINFVSDMLNENGSVLSLNEMKQVYHSNINFLNYYAISGLVKKFISKNKKGDKLDILKPYIPFHVKTIVNLKKHTRNQFKGNKCNDLLGQNEIKWNRDLNLEQDQLFWKCIYKGCFWSIQDNVYIWFQYRILRKILGTNNLLFKIKVSQSSQCRLCSEQTETISHLFSQCSKSIDLWENIKVWIKSKIGYILTLNSKLMILGENNFDEHFWPLNFVLIVTRYYIFACAQKSQMPNIYVLQKKLKSIYQEQEILSQLNNYENKFAQNWVIWRSIFDNI